MNNKEGDKRRQVKGGVASIVKIERFEREIFSLTTELYDKGFEKGNFSSFIYLFSSGFVSGRCFCFQFLFFFFISKNIQYNSSHGNPIIVRSSSIINL